MSDDRKMIERVKDISIKLSDNMGYVSSGKQHWGIRAMNEAGDNINFDKVYDFINGDRRKRRMIAAVLADGNIMDTFFNHPDPISAIADEYGFGIEDIKLLQEECSKTRVRQEVADNLSALRLYSGTTYMGRNIDEEVIDFARSYNNGRIPYTDANVIPPDEMGSICDKVDKMISMAQNKEEEEVIHRDFLRILNEKYGKRKNQINSKTIIFHECAKTMLKYGIIPSENYREWGDQAIALSCLYRQKRKNVMWAIRAAASMLFDLSHWDEHPEAISEKMISDMESYVEAIEDAELPVGFCIKYEFLNKEHHDSAYLFNILARLSTKCGRKKKKKSRRRRTQA